MDIRKPSIVAVVRALAPGTDLHDDVHGWKPIRCPFHDDRAASASYNTTIQRFKCHACQVGGDGYDLIMEIEHCDFATALRRAESITGSAVSLGVMNAQSSQTGRSKLTERKTKERRKLIRKKFTGQ